VKRAEKAKIIDDLHQKAEKASIALATDFKGLKVEEMNELRVKLREGNVDYQVVKNTLGRLALQDSSHEVIKDELKECCALAFGYDDPVVAAKMLVDYTKKNKKFAIRFGSLQGKYLSAEDITELSKLPGREELIAKVLGTFNAVPTNFVGLFANLLRNFLYALNGIKEQKEQS
jgi:large subunit ribosomal protein L10